MSLLHTCGHRRRLVARLAPLFVAAGVGLLLAGCGAGAIREQFRPTSPREAYVEGLRAAGLDRTALGRDWAAAGDRAAAAPAAAALPLREQGAFVADQAAAVAWRVQPRRGQRLTVRVEAQADSGTRLFHDLLVQPGGDPARARVVRSGDGLRASYEVDADAADDSYLFRLQPELLRTVRWTVTFEVGPSLAFPVQGRSRGAVQSFWGANRDGGARAHEGIDIFAPRGTPALAAADGVVRWVGENRLGGNVVFLADPERGHSLYYAHLDRQAVTTGQQVRAGDTLGFVGNTGNARTTSPHLHFGVYRAGEGAVDPFPYVDTRRPAPPPVPGRDAALVGRLARVTAARAVLRAGPDGRTAAVAELPRSTVATVDAAAGGTLRVRLPDGRAGYVAGSALEAADRPVGRARLAAGRPLRARPTPDAPALAEGDGREGAVYGRFGAYQLVALDGGRRGWLEPAPGDE